MEVRPAILLRARHHNLATMVSLRGFLVSCVELGLSGFSKWRADQHLPSNSPKNRGKTGIFADDHVEIKDTGQQN